MKYTGKNRVLFVNGEEMIARMGKRLLSRYGFDVTVTGSSEEALQLFSGDPCPFDIVVTDQSMPDLTGIKLTQQLLHVRPDIPIILFCGYSDFPVTGWTKAAGCVEYLIKPLGIDNLASSLKIILENNVTTSAAQPH